MDGTGSGSLPDLHDIDDDYYAAPVHQLPLPSTTASSLSLALSSHSTAARFPVDDGTAAVAKTKRCTVKGCTARLPMSAPTKMCDSCRERHRQYAITKRARRKMEKLVLGGIIGGSGVGVGVGVVDGTTPTIANAARAGMQAGREGLAVVHENGIDSDTDGWFSAHPEALAHGNTHISTNTLLANIDPRLFTPEEHTLPTTPVPLPMPIPAPYSELAGALTPRSAKRPSNPTANPFAEHLSFSPSSSQQQQQQPVASTLASTSTPTAVAAAGTANASASRPHTSEPPLELGDGPTKPCSVKGCKLLIPASYPYKMCPTCRDRYRTYGVTKRAKSKAERANFDLGMEALRRLEDENRRMGGLGPLEEHPDELRDWEQRVMNEHFATLAEAQADALARLGGVAGSDVDLTSGASAAVGAVGVPDSDPYPNHAAIHEQTLQPTLLRYRMRVSESSIDPATTGLNSNMDSNTNLTLDPNANLNPNRPGELAFSIPGNPSASTSSLPSTSTLPSLPSTSTLPLPSTSTSTSTLSSTSTFSSTLGPPGGTNTPNLLPRVCTVSHCRVVLPGWYRFKRCEAHRRQNREAGRIYWENVRKKDREERIARGEVVDVPQVSLEDKADEGEGVVRKRKHKLPHRPANRRTPSRAPRVLEWWAPTGWRTCVRTC